MSAISIGTNNVNFRSIVEYELLKSVCFFTICFDGRKKKPHPENSEWGFYDRDPVLYFFAAAFFAGAFLAAAFFAAGFFAAAFLGAASAFAASAASFGFGAGFSFFTGAT